MCYFQWEEKERSENALEKEARELEIRNIFEIDSEDEAGGSRVHSGSYYSLNIAFKDMDFTYSDIYRD